MRLRLKNIERKIFWGIFESDVNQASYKFMKLKELKLSLNL